MTGKHTTSVSGRNLGASLKDNLIGVMMALLMKADFAPVSLSISILVQYQSIDLTQESIFSAVDYIRSQHSYSNLSILDRKAYTILNSSTAA